MANHLPLAVPSYGQFGGGGCLSRHRASLSSARASASMSFSSVFRPRSRVSRRGRPPRSRRSAHAPGAGPSRPHCARRASPRRVVRQRRHVPPAQRRAPHALVSPRPWQRPKLLPLLRSRACRDTPHRKRPELRLRLLWPRRGLLAHSQHPPRRRRDWHARHPRPPARPRARLRAASSAASATSFSDVLGLKCLASLLVQLERPRHAAAHLRHRSSRARPERTK